MCWLVLATKGQSATLDMAPSASGICGPQKIGLFISDSWERRSGASLARALFWNLLLLPLFPSVHVRIGVISGAVGTLYTTALKKGFAWCVATLGDGCQKSGLTAEQGRGCISHGLLASGHLALCLSQQFWGPW